MPEPIAPVDEEEVITPSPEPEAPELEELEELSEEEPEVEEEPENPAEQEEKQPPSRRESLRIQKLVSKLRDQQQPAEAPPKKGGLDYRTALDADDEVITQLESDREIYGTDRFNEGMKQAQSIQFHTRLEIDAPRVESKYPQFDKESPKFNPQVANAVNQWYLATAGYNPKTNTVANADVRYSDFVDGVMELANEIGNEQVAQTRRTVNRQAASTGLRPDGSSPKRLNLNQAPEDMTDEELEAKISQAFSSRR